MEARKVIVLDDEEMMLRSLKRRFKVEQSNYELHCYDSPIAALAKLDEGPVYAFITDVRMPGMNGDQVVEFISKNHPAQKCIVITGHAERNAIQRIVKTGNVKGILLKPLDFDKLVATLDSLGEEPSGGNNQN